VNQPFTLKKFYILDFSLCGPPLMLLSISENIFLYKWGIRHVVVVVANLEKENGACFTRLEELAVIPPFSPPRILLHAQ
jgi:hypothetical protein